MDTKTIIVTLVCAVLGSSALTAVVNAVVFVDDNFNPTTSGTLRITI